MRTKKFHAALFATGLATVSAFAGGIEVAPIPDYFSGFFVGGTGAFHMTAFDGSTSVTAPQDVTLLLTNFEEILVNEPLFPAGTILSFSNDGNAFDGYYGVQGGVGKVFNHRWYVGFLGFGEWGSQSDTSPVFTQFKHELTDSVVEGINGNYSSSTTVKISNDYGVAFKPGFLVAPKSMVYGKIGAIWANIKVSNTTSGVNSFDVVDSGVLNFGSIGSFSESSENSDNKVALLLGVGFEQFVYRDMVTVNIEYNYANYGRVSTSSSVTGQGTVNALTIPPPGMTGDLNAPINVNAFANAKVSTLLGGINIYFGSHWF
jgi:hypothetical protein